MDKLTIRATSPDRNITSYNKARHEIFHGKNNGCLLTLWPPLPAPQQGAMTLRPQLAQRKVQHKPTWLKPEVPGEIREEMQ